jgi:CubicO group peptidase (beta-lactamase class C family)
MKAFCFLSVLVLISCSVKEDRTMHIGSRMDEYFMQKFTDSLPGGAVLLLKNDSILFHKGYGLADLKTRERITTKTLFNLGSISKTFVANAILILQEQGKLSVEDSLYKYFPAFKNKAIARRVKIKHLLTHTSGLPDIRQVDKDTAFYLTAKDEENWAPIMQTETLVFEPGTHYEYSNPAFNGLALIVEQVSGMKWQKFIVDNILIPSGMKESTITDGAHPTSGVAHAYVKVADRWKEDDYGEEPTFAASGNGGVWSSAEELVLYEKALRSSLFLKQETIRQSQTYINLTGWAEPLPLERGWAWEIKQTPDSLKIVSHHGTQGGFVANYVSVPEKKILFVILCNAPYPDEEFTAQVMKWLLEEQWSD